MNVFSSLSMDEKKLLKSAMDGGKFNQDELMPILKKIPIEVRQGLMAEMSGQEEMAPLPSKDIVQEMHPDVSILERMVNKNFAVDQKAQIDYLKQKHPEMEFDTNNDQIIMKKANEDQWRVMDPDTGFFSKDFLSDAGDVAYDVASGIPVNVAQKLGGLLGSILPGPGTLMGAAGAGGTTNAASEWLRQKIGQMSGIPQEMDTDQIKLAAAIGALSPVVMGNDLVNPSTRQMFTNSANELKEKLPSLLQKMIAPKTEKELARASEGLIKRGLIGSGSLASGIEGETLREGYDRLAGIKYFEKTGVSDFVEETHEQIKHSLNAAKQKAGSEIGKVLDESGELIDLSSTKNEFKGLIAEYEKSAEQLDTPAMWDKLKEVKSLYDDFFGKDAAQVVESMPTGLMDEFGQPITRDVIVKPATKAPTQISANAAFELQQQLGELSNIQKSGAGIISRFSKQPISDKRIGDTAGKSMRELSDSINKSIERASQKKADFILSEYAKKYPQEMMGKTPAEVAQMRDNILNTMPSITGLKTKYSELSRLQRDIAPKFSSPEKTYNTLRNMQGKNKQFFLEKIEKMDKELGTNVLDKARSLETFSLFSNAVTNPISGELVTSTSKTISNTIPSAALGSALGYYLGANSGMGMGGAGVGMGVGAFLGSKAGSPAAMRLFMEIGKKNELLKKNIPDFAKQSIWNTMMNTNAQME